MARLRGAPLVVEYSSANLARLHRAAFHGFADVARPGDFDPPELVERLPTRAWCAAFYTSWRDRFIADFDDRLVFLAAWPVATFETDDEALRARAAVVVVAEQSRPDPRPTLTQPNLKGP